MLPLQRAIHSYHSYDQVAPPKVAWEPTSKPVRTIRGACSRRLMNRSERSGNVDHAMNESKEETYRQMILGKDYLLAFLFAVIRDIDILPSQERNSDFLLKNVKSRIEEKMTYAKGAAARRGGTAFSRGGGGLRRRGVVMALSSLVLMSGLATGAAAQTCSTTDDAITGVTPAPSDPAALAGDCTTLLGLMDTLRGTASLNWANNLSMTSWNGVFVRGSRVIGLRLNRSQLTGTIPAALNSLTGLTEIWLNNNRLSGSIPTLSTLTSLTTLLLNGNELSGQIPDLSSLTSLENLQLQDNELSGQIPATLNSLTSLNSISLSDNRLTGSIPDLSALTSLRSLNLYRNRLTGSIPDLSSLTSLENLQLSTNRLTGSIPDLSALTSLDILFLHRNQLSGSIPDLSGLTSLSYLLLSDNQLTGSIDASNFPTSLTYLYLHLNRLSGSFPDLSVLTSLQRLTLFQNRLSGPLPTWWGSLPALEWLLLAGTPLTGGIPSQLGSLSNLTRLSLCGTDLDASATLPSALETRRTANNLSVWSCVRIEDASATEGVPLRFAVEHSTYPVRGEAGATGGLTLSYETRDGTADSDDYSGTSEGRVTIPANTDSDDSTSSAAISVPTIVDAIDDSGETMTVTLRPAAPATSWGPLHPLRRSATGNILNDPAPPPLPPPDPDEDGDGIPDAVETGDGNEDGVPDAEQSHVLSFLCDTIATARRNVTLEVPEQVRITGVRASRRLPRGYPPLPPEVTASSCFLGFYLGRVGRGGAATVSVYLPGGLDINSYWQYGPTPDNGEPHWYPFEHDSETGAAFPEAGRVDLHFIDGGRGDHDERRNGAIESFGAAVLAVPALAPATIGLPGEAAAVGMALYNPTDADNVVALSVTDAGGELRRRLELSEALAEKEQLARMVCELIDCEMESGAAAVVARGRQGHLRSMFMVGTGDGRKLDGLSGRFKPARRLLFPIIQSEGESATVLFVFNPSRVETAVAFSRYRKDGSLSAAESRTVAGGGFVMEEAAVLFGGADESGPGYVEARAERSLLGFTFLRDEESFAALAAQTPQEIPDDESFYAPHFEMGAESRTSLYLLSALAAHTTRVRVRAFDDHGNPVGEAERELSRDDDGLLLAGNLGELLQLPASEQREGRLEGYLQLDASVTAGVLLHLVRPRVLGAVEVVRGGSRTVLPLVGPEDTATRSFLQVAHSESPDSYMTTSLSILNPGPQTAMVTLRVYDPAGRPSAPDRIVSIVPGGRLGGSLEAQWPLDPQFTQVGGHLQVISDRPVISFALFRGRNGQYLSAISARPGSP